MPKAGKWCVLLERSRATLCCRGLGNIPRRFNKCNGETGARAGVLSVLFITNVALPDQLTRLDFYLSDTGQLRSCMRTICGAIQLEAVHLILS